MVPREVLKQQEKEGRDTKDVWTNWQPKEDHIIVGKFETKILKLLDDRLGCVSGRFPLFASRHQLLVAATKSLRKASEGRECFISLTVQGFSLSGWGSLVAGS